MSAAGQGGDRAAVLGAEKHWYLGPVMGRGQHSCTFWDGGGRWVGTSSAGLYPDLMALRSAG